MPKHVGTLAKVLVMSAMPKFVGPTFGAALLLPKEVGALANNLVEALLRLGKHVSITPYGSRAPPRLTCILVVDARARAQGRKVPTPSAEQPIRCYPIVCPKVT